MSHEAQELMQGDVFNTVAAEGGQLSATQNTPWGETDFKLLIKKQKSQKEPLTLSLPKGIQTEKPAKGRAHHPGIPTKTGQPGETRQSLPAGRPAVPHGFWKLCTPCLLFLVHLSITCFPCSSVRSPTDASNAQ